MADQKRASFAIEDMKTGGGNLWGTAGPVRATVIAGKFTKEAPEGYNAQGNPIFAHVDFLLAGDAPEEERRVNNSWSLGAQAGDNFTISENGDFLVPVADDSAIVKDCKFGTFAASLQNEGVPKPVMADFSFSRIVGLDGDFKRIADKARDFQRPNEAKPKFPPSTLCLVKLYAMPGEKATAAGAKPAGKTAAVAQTAAATPAATTAAPAGDFDLDSATLDVLSAVLKSKGGTEQRGRLTLLVSKQAMSDPNRSAMARRASEESYIQSLVDAGLVTYAASEKGQPVSLVA